MHLQDIILQVKMACIYKLHNITFNTNQMMTMMMIIIIMIIIIIIIIPE